MVSYVNNNNKTHIKTKIPACACALAQPSAAFGIRFACLPASFRTPLEFAEYYNDSEKNWKHGASVQIVKAATQPVVFHTEKRERMEECGNSAANLTIEVYIIFIALHHFVRFPTNST